MVGLANVDNTSDASKPISSATQTALDAKQNNITSVENGNTITSLGNNQRVVATTDAKLKFQRFDDDGVITTDAWSDQLSMDWNTNTNKATVVIPNNLTVGENLTIAGTNVMTELNAINTELDNKVDTFLVNTQLAW
jgi:hypothetical protein